MSSAHARATEQIVHALMAGASTPIMVRTIAGLERLAAAELAQAGYRVTMASRRQLLVEAATWEILARPPRLADDLFLLVATLPDPGRTRPELAVLGRRLAQRLDTRIRHGAADTLAVSASFDGRRTFTRYDVEDLVGAALAGRIGGVYHSRRHGAPPAGSTQWRVTLDEAVMRIGIRPFEAPLHRRLWRVCTVAGSLHPPVAAAAARLARIKPGHTVLDPFCGAGTMLLEAHDIQPAATHVGIDRDALAIDAAKANCSGRGGLTWTVGDAGKLAMTAGGVDRILTNPPWGVRIKLTDLRSYTAQWHRALRPGGLVVAVVHSDQVPALSGDRAWHVLQDLSISVGGQHPHIIVARPHT